ncbi:MAG: metallophosphoesterase [Candidatus Aminicenantaceae bacterium]
MRPVWHVLFIGLITVLCLTVALAGERPCEWTGIKKIIAIGDLHGDYENFVEILKGVQLVDDSLHWIGGDIHFVQTGDILDRGPEARKIFDLIRRLETEAEEAGGMVHMLIGNHEEINITGIAFSYVGYVTVEQFISFLPEKFKEKREEEFRKKFEEKSSDSTNSDISYEAELRNYWAELLKENREAQRKYTNNFNEEYGKWIIEHNAAIKINDIVFVHGGISKIYSKEKIKVINNQLRYELDALRIAWKQRRQSLRFKTRIVHEPKGPLWYRGLAEENEGFVAELEQILKNLEANYMVVAHTPRIGSRIATEKYMSRYDGRIWIIDTGISEFYGGFLSALIIEDGGFEIWLSGGGDEN